MIFHSFFNVNFLIGKSVRESERGGKSSQRQERSERERGARMLLLKVRKAL